MPAINFQLRFARKIITGQKTATIRQPRKRPMKEGDKVYLYHGMRVLKPAVLLGTAIISEVRPVRLDTENYWIEPLWDGLNRQVMPHPFTDKIAKELLGFKDWIAAMKFYEESYPNKKKIDAEITLWSDFKPNQNGVDRIHQLLPTKSKQMELPL